MVTFFSQFLWIVFSLRVQIVPFKLTVTNDPTLAIPTSPSVFRTDLLARLIKLLVSYCIFFLKTVTPKKHSPCLTQEQEETRALSHNYCTTYTAMTMGSYPMCHLYGLRSDQMQSDATTQFNWNGVSAWCDFNHVAVQSDFLWSTLIERWRYSSSKTG